MNKRKSLVAITIVMLAFGMLSCQVLGGLPIATSTVPPTSTLIPSPLPPIPVKPGAANPDEPVYITGSIPYTFPFFLETISEPFVMLEDEAGFVKRNLDFQFPLRDQVIGPVTVHQDNTLTFSLALPAIPQGTMVDVDNNGKEDQGVQVFAIAYWSNTWGGPFIEKRDGTGWSTNYSSTTTDAERNFEINGGILLVWAPDDQQGFPTGFGADNKLFTPDDPTGPIPAGYNLVDLDQKPFKIYKEARPNLVLNEGDLAVNDLSKLSYSDAFEAFFKKASVQYPFTDLKHVNWTALHDKFAPRIASAKTKDDFYRAMHAFILSIPDTHIGMTVDPQVFYEEDGGGFGLVLAELSDGSVIAAQVLPNDPAQAAGIQVGAEIVTWDGQPVKQAIDKVDPFFGPFSTQQSKRLEQVAFLTRVPPNTTVNISFKNPGDAQEKEASMNAKVEYDSLFNALPEFNQDALLPSIDGDILKGSGLGYIRITTFSDDFNLMAHLWENYIGKIIDNKVPGLIIDIRVNPGGNSELAGQIASYFYDKEITLYSTVYYNDLTGDFQPQGKPSTISPAPKYYDGPVALLVSPNCVSACEGFAYAMTRDNRSIVVGHYPTAGAYGEVGRGQYDLPDDFSLQIPTGRSITPDGKLVIEGVGIIPNITVPVTLDSATGKVDTVLQAAIKAVQDKIGK
jgi:C-terminal processing protease CtpA/Prc